MLLVGNVAQAQEREGDAPRAARRALDAQALGVQGCGAVRIAAAAGEVGQVVEHRAHIVRVPEPAEEGQALFVERGRPLVVALTCGQQPQVRERVGDSWSCPLSRNPGPGWPPGRRARWRGPPDATRTAPAPSSAPTRGPGRPSGAPASAWPSQARPSAKSPRMSQNSHRAPAKRRKFAGGLGVVAMPGQGRPHIVALTLQPAQAVVLGGAGQRGHRGLRQFQRPGGVPAAGVILGSVGGMAENGYRQQGNERNAGALEESQSAHRFLRDGAGSGAILYQAERGTSAGPRLRLAPIDGSSL